MVDLEKLNTSIYNKMYTLNGFDKKRLNTFKKYMGKNRKVLEVTGGNLLLSRFYDKSNEVTLVDISDGVLKNAKKFVAHTKKVDLNKGKLPFKDNTFDVVIAGEILEHLYSPEEIVSEAHRILKKGGIFIGSVPNAFNYRRRIETIFGVQDESPIDSEHIRFFNLKYIKKLLSKKFVVEEVVSSSRITFLIGIMAGGFIWKCRKKS